MSRKNDTILATPIEYIKGVGPQRADLLKKESGIFTFGDMLEHFPFRHIDKTVITPIKDVNFQSDYVQIAGRLLSVELIGNNKFKRLVAIISDGTGTLELVWFQGINWIHKTLITGSAYIVFGKVGAFNGQLQISHPEIEYYSP